MHTIDLRTEFAQARLAIVISRFNEDITTRLLDGAVARLRELKLDTTNLQVVWVPGAVEIPIVAAKLAESKKYDSIIALGAVIRGETTHYDYVCDQVSQGCQKVSLDTGVPVIFGVLTTENEEQAVDRLGGKHGHKGKDAVDTALEMVAVLKKL